MRYIGVDLGTSAVKLILVDEAGTVYRGVSKKYPLEYPKPGWSQQNPKDWYDGMLAGIKELLENEDTTLVKGISFSGQMHGLVMLDKNNQVIRPAILWNDGRAEKETEYLNTVIGKKKLSNYTGNIAFTGFTAPKLLWVYNHEPENFKKIDKIMLPKDYLAYRLSGVHCTDVSDASGTLLFNVKNRVWSPDMTEICHIREEQLPRVFESHESVGNILPEMAEELHLSKDVKIIAGAGDNAAAAVGNGVVGAGKCNISLGTSGTIFITGKEFRVDENNALHSFAHADGSYHLMGCMLSAASCNDWWMKKILGSDDFTGAQEDIKILGQNNVFFLPYLMGERSPHNDPSAKGAFVGMTMNTNRSDMLQAVLEGVAFALRDSLEIAKKQGYVVSSTRVCGGGAKSTLWVKLLANILDLEVELLESKEGPALGAGILAAVGCGEYATVREAVIPMVKVREKVLPDKHLVEKYDRQYRVFREIYPQLAPVYQSIRKMQEVSG